MSAWIVGTPVGGVCRVVILVTGTAKPHVVGSNSTHDEIVWNETWVITKHSKVETDWFCMVLMLNSINVVDCIR